MSLKVLIHMLVVCERTHQLLRNDPFLFNGTAGRNPGAGRILGADQIPEVGQTLEVEHQTMMSLKTLEANYLAILHSVGMGKQAIPRNPMSFQRLNVLLQGLAKGARTPSQTSLRLLQIKRNFRHSRKKRNELARFKTL